MKENVDLIKLISKDHRSSANKSSKSLKIKNPRPTSANFTPLTIRNDFLKSKTVKNVNMVDKD